MLIDACIQEDDKLYLCVSSPTIKDKPVSHITVFKFQSYQLTTCQLLAPGTNSTLAAQWRRLRIRCFHATGSTEDRFRWGRASTTEGSGACHDHGSTVRGRLLRRHRHWPRAEVPEGRRQSCLLQPAELHCRHQCSLRAAATCRHWETGGDQALHPRRPNLRRVSGHPVRGQVCALLLREHHLSAVLLWELLGEHPLGPGQGEPQALDQGGWASQGHSLSMVLEQCQQSSVRVSSSRHRCPVDWPLWSLTLTNHWLAFDDFTVIISFLLSPLLLFSSFPFLRRCFL